MGRITEFLKLPAENSVQLKKNNDKLFLEEYNRQLEQDIINQEKINSERRRCMKCMRGKRPNYLNIKAHDRKLARMFIEKGRKKRMSILEAEIAELDIKLTVARGKLNTKEDEENYEKIAEHLKLQTEMEEQIKKVNLEIDHINSQFERLNRKDIEFSHETEAEVDFQEHLKKAIRELEIYENRVEVSRQRECKLTAENRKLATLLHDMLIARGSFNIIWRKFIKNLKNRKKFLLDMIERTSTAFSQDAELMNNYMKLVARRKQDKDLAIAEMLKMKRQIDANDIKYVFLGGKGKRRDWAPLEECEVNRRENLKIKYSEKINFYQQIIDEIKKFAGHTEDDPFEKTLEYIATVDNDTFQFYNYHNKLSCSIEIINALVKQTATDINTDLSSIDNINKVLENRVKELNKELQDEINKTIKMKSEQEKVKDEMGMVCKGLQEIIEEVGCDTSCFDARLGNFKTLNLENYKMFLEIFEKRMNEIIAAIYCDERDEKDLNLLTDDDDLVVASLKRDDGIPIVNLEDVITTQQCAECAELEDVNRYDDNFVAMLDENGVREAMINKIGKMEMNNRMHNLSACKLPRSGIIASRRYAQ